MPCKPIRRAERALRRGDRRRLVRCLRRYPKLKGPLLESWLEGRFHRMEPSLLQALLRAGLDRRQPLNRHGFTLLMAAACFDRPMLVDILLRAGAPVDAVNDDGETALSYAANSNAQQVAEMLLEAGADATQSDNVALITARCWSGRRLQAMLETRGATTELEPWGAFWIEGDREEIESRTESGTWQRAPNPYPGWDWTGDWPPPGPPPSEPTERVVYVAARR